MPPSITNATHQCAKCNSPATMNCSACVDVPGSDGKTWYCNASCQQSHWSTHKDICKALRARKILYRAASLLQDMFYTYRLHIFDMLIVRTKVEGRRMYLYEGVYPTLRNAVDFICEFPVGLLTNTEDQRTVLTYQACSDVPAWMHDVIKYILTGFTPPYFI